ncbi:hypothetical protein L3Q82_001670 [Scortum barcoo]|uniref:Uncharacterized protein n=1 Tax=Scortum barcoo TaxID=214431 RepID=A0ACB8W578_9TELE|nr:hypothetical protein L3Q82_001670 [Scortum barcoo]
MTKPTPINVRLAKLMDWESFHSVTRSYSQRQKEAVYKWLRYEEITALVIKYGHFRQQLGEQAVDWVGTELNSTLVLAQKEVKKIAPSHSHILHPGSTIIPFCPLHTERPITQASHHSGDPIEAHLSQGSSLPNSLRSPLKEQSWLPSSSPSNTADSTHNSDNCSLQKFSDDSAVARLVTDGDDREDREVTRCFVEWCQLNRLHINAGKTQELLFHFNRI